MASTTNGSQPTFEIPKMCKAGIVKNEGENFTVEVEMVPVPEPAPDEILIRLNCTGVCGSDVHYMKGDLGRPPMSHFGVKSAGHEGAGVVVKVGANVQNWKVGDRAGIKPMWTTCQNCELCWTGKEAHCPKTLMAGSKVTGSFQQYITSPGSYTQPIPDGVDDYTAGPIMCSGGTMFRSLQESGLKAGNFAVFPGGGGGVGLQGVQLARNMGIWPIVIDTGAEKRELCMKRGAENFIDFKEVKDTTAEVVRLCGGKGAHGVFVTAPSAYANAISYVGTRIGAVVMCVGIRKSFYSCYCISTNYLSCSACWHSDYRCRSSKVRHSEPHNQRYSCCFSCRYSTSTGFCGERCLTTHSHSCVSY